MLEPVQNLHMAKNQLLPHLAALLTHLTSENFLQIVAYLKKIIPCHLRKITCDLRQKILNRFLKIFFLSLLAFGLLSCGFNVIYKDDDDISSNARDLSLIRIKKDRDHLSQTLKNNLYDLLNPDDIKAEPKYFLILKTTKTVFPTFITTTGASGRNRVTLNVQYELKNLETAATISSGSTSVNDNYDVSTNRYGTYTADEYVSLNLTKIAAQNIRNSLVNDLIETKKKCDKNKQDRGFVCPL